MSGRQFAWWWIRRCDRKHLAVVAAAEAALAFVIALAAMLICPAWWAAMVLGAWLYALHIGTVLAALSDVGRQGWIRSKSGGPHL